jgi:hypothetical protein
MAETSKTLRRQVVLMPSASSSGSPGCKCGNIRSTVRKKIPPAINPTTAGIHGDRPLASESSMAGAKSEK